MQAPQHMKSLFNEAALLDYCKYLDMLPGEFEGEVCQTFMEGTFKVLHTQLVLRVKYNGTVLTCAFDPSQISRGLAFYRLVTSAQFCQSCGLYYILQQHEFSRNGWCTSCSFQSLQAVPDDDCSICLEPLSAFACKHLGCKHVLHMRCYSDLPREGVENEHGAIREEVKCPLCRAVHVENN